MSIQENILVSDKLAIRVSATWVREAPSGRADLYDCEGDEVWVPKSVCNYHPDSEELDIQEWFYKQLEQEGKL